VRTGLVTVTVGARDARIAADPADFAGAQCELLGQATGLAAAAVAAPARRRERLRRQGLEVADDRHQQLAPALMGVG
jgi:hypothetical protein